MRRSAISVVLAVVVAACSLVNREGPDVSCADLNDGAINACDEGIIATCSNAVVSWTVCDDEETCDATWQVAGAFSCEQGGPAPAGSGGSGASSTSTGAGGSGGCNADGACVVATSDREIAAFAVQEDRLVFIDAEKVQAVNLSGGFPTVVASGFEGAGRLGQLAVDDTSAYFIEVTSADYEYSIVEVPLAGGPPETFFSLSSGEIGALTADQDHVYWSGGDGVAAGIFRKPKLGGAVEEVVANEFFVPKLILAGGSLYWPGGNDNTVKRVDLSGSIPAVATSIPIGHRPDDIAVGPDTLFFVSGTSDLVAKLPLSGGPFVDLATDQTTAERLAIDDNWVYYVPTNALPGADLRRVNQQGGAPQVVAEAENGFSIGNNVFGALAVDDTHLYWLEGTRVMRAPK